MNEALVKFYGVYWAVEYESNIDGAYIMSVSIEGSDDIYDSLTEKFINDLTEELKLQLS